MQVWSPILQNLGSKFGVQSLKVWGQSKFPQSLRILGAKVWGQSKFPQSLRILGAGIWGSE